MAKIKPFKALFYNPECTSDLSRLICPPYDVISPEQQESFLKQDEHNFIHILLGKDAPNQDRYSLASHLFHSWQKEKILIQDNQEAIYFYQQRFRFRGEQKTRLGFIALLRLDPSNSSVFAHEHTRPAPKEDRYRILQAVRANLSPIFVIFQDKKRLIQQIWKNIESTPPFLKATDNDSVSHTLWRINHPDLIAEVCSKMNSENFFIADGHHRYEVACYFRDVELKKKNPVDPEASFNYIMTYFTNTSASGLMILPVHRLLKVESRPSFPELMEKLSLYFDLEPVKDAKKFLFLLEKAGRSEHIIGMYLDKGFWLLRLKNVKILDKVMPDKPLDYRRLDVAILNHLVLEPIFGLEKKEEAKLYYSPYAEEIISRADEEPQKTLAFFVNPVRIEQLIAVALAGQKLPPKSTYFYPKLASGLLVHKFE